jgi:hypothetical protein
LNTVSAHLKPRPFILNIIPIHVEVNVRTGSSIHTTAKRGFINSHNSEARVHQFTQQRSAGSSIHTTAKHGSINSHNSEARLLRGIIVIAPQLELTYSPLDVIEVLIDRWWSTVTVTFVCPPEAIKGELLLQGSQAVLSSSTGYTPSNKSVTEIGHHRSIDRWWSTVTVTFVHLRPSSFLQ